MKKLILATAALLSAVSATDASPLRTVVQAYYQQNNTVQRAIYRDACLHWDMLKENHTARAKLGRVNKLAYDKVSQLMGDAYGASEGTDSAVEQVQKDFCHAADNR